MKTLSKRINRSSLYFFDLDTTSIEKITSFYLSNKNHTADNHIELLYPIELAQSYKLMGDISSALKVLEQVPNEEFYIDESLYDGKQFKSPQWYRLYTTFLLEIGEKDKALDYAQMAVSIMPENANVYDTLAMVFQQLGNSKEANETTNKVNELFKQQRDIEYR